MDGALEHAVSGLYIAHLVRNDTGGESQIFFVVRDDSSHSDVVLKTSDTTWQAYNAYGGNSLYTCTVSCPTGNPLALQGRLRRLLQPPVRRHAHDRRRLLRPLLRRVPADPLPRANGYDVSYVSGRDVDSSGGAAAEPQGLHLQRPRRVLVGGRAQRRRSRRATPGSTSPSSAATRCSGRRAGRTAQRRRRTRPTAPWSPTRTPTSDAPVDPPDPSVTTGTWRDPRFSPPGDGGQPGERAHRPALHRQLGHLRHQGARRRSPNCASGATPGVADPDRRPDADARPGHRDARLRVGRRPDNGFRPPGLIRCPRRPSAGSQTFTDYGTDVDDDRHRDPQPHALPGAERRAGLRRRHGPVVLGTRRHQRLAPAPARRQAARPEHAAGDGQPVRRHGRPAGDPAEPGLVAASASTDTHRRRPRRSPRPPNGASLPGRQPRRRSPAPRRDTAAASSPASRSRPTAARPGTPASGTTIVDLLVGRPRQPRRRRSRPARSTTAATSAPPARRDRSPSPARARSSAGRHPGDRRLRRRAARSSSGSSSAATSPARSPASASTRPPPTPAPTSAACGPRPARCSPRRPSPARRQRAGSR